MAKIPPRNPIGDPFDGVLLRYATAIFLSDGPREGAEVIGKGVYTVRYGLPYVDKPALSMVPGLLALDYGEMLTGDEMWDFMRTRFSRYPRADVLGYRSDGKDEMVVLKKLDMAQPVAVLAYDGEAATQPTATVDALILPEEDVLPERMGELVPRYTTIDQWRNRD